MSDISQVRKIIEDGLAKDRSVSKYRVVNDIFITFENGYLMNKAKAWGKTTCPMSGARRVLADSKRTLSKTYDFHKSGWITRKGEADGIGMPAPTNVVTVVDLTPLPTAVPVEELAKTFNEYIKAAPIKQLDDDDLGIIRLDLFEDLEHWQPHLWQTEFIVSELDAMLKTGYDEYYHDNLAAELWGKWQADFKAYLYANHNVTI